jgi:AraC-like DNA-binding protein
MIPTSGGMHTIYVLVAAPLPVVAINAGLFISRGRGRHPERVIDSYQLIFVNEGEIDMWEEDRVFHLTPGQTLLLEPGRKHGGFGQYKPESSFYWVHFTIDRSRPGVSGHRLEIPKVAPLEYPDRLIEIFRRFLDDQESGTLTRLRGSLLVMQMLAEIADPPPSQNVVAESNVILADRANRFIRAHFHESISTATVADRLKSNPDYLGRVFRAVYRRSITRYIHERRMHYARTLLLNTDFNTNEIAAACGFRYTNYFLRLFRRYEGMTPKAFRALFARTHVNAER